MKFSDVAAQQDDAASAKRLIDRWQDELAELTRTEATAGLDHEGAQRVEYLVNVIALHGDYTKAMAEQAVTISIAPPPEGWMANYPCGCSFEGRCERHGGMMKAIHAAWNRRPSDRVLLNRIWSLSDGYGEPGSVPAQGWDWSGIRDSTPAAVERMAAVLMNAAGPRS
jgi:hypothetical protein